MGAEVFGGGVRGMASEPQEFKIDSDGWCLYNAYLKVFTPYRDIHTRKERTEKALELAKRLVAIATDEDKAYIQERLTNPEYDGIAIVDTAGSRTGAYGYPSQIPADDNENYVEVSGTRRKVITDADDYLRAMKTPVFDTTGIQPEAWGSISLLHPLFIRFRPDIYFDVRVRDSTGEVDANAGRSLLGQEGLKYLGPNGERNLSFISSGPHYDVRVYTPVDDDPFGSQGDNDDLVAATLGSLLLSSASATIDAESETGASISRINKLASSVPRTNGIEFTTLRPQQAPTIAEEPQKPFIPREPVPHPGSEKRVRNLKASIGAVPVSYNRQLNVARTQTTRSLPLTSKEQGVAGKAVRRVGAAIASTVPEPGGVEYIPKPIPSTPSIGGLFPTISIPSFDSTSIPQPRHRRRHAYRRFIAPPPAPVATSVGPRPTRSTEIPAWARQHITEANIATNVKGVAAAVVDDVLAMQNYRGVNADPAYASYKADPKTRGLNTNSGDSVHWEEISERYPDQNVLIRDASDKIHRFHVSNPYRAASYRRKPTFTFGDPAGLNPQQSAMAQQNLDVLMEIAPEEMIADTKFATALLESLWYCGSGHDIGGDPRCFPARVLGELREYKMFKDEKARASFAARAQQYSEWGFIKGVLKKVRGQLKGTNVQGPVRVSGVPSTAPGPNLSIAAASSVAALSGRIANVGKPPEEEPVPEEPIVPSAAQPMENTNVGPSQRRRLRPLARIPVAPPPAQLGAIGIIPQPPPTTLGVWGSRFRPIIPT